MNVPGISTHFEGLAMITFRSVARELVQAHEAKEKAVNDYKKAHDAFNEYVEKVGFSDEPDKAMTVGVDASRYGSRQSATHLVTFDGGGLLEILPFINEYDPELPDVPEDEDEAEKVADTAEADAKAALDEVF